MAIPALALLNRSLREDVRLFRPHFLRFLFVAFIFVAMVVAHYSSTTFSAPGLQFFRSVSLLNFAIITLATVSYFATAITEEKDEQTLGLLKMAGLGAFGLLLGKAAPRLIATGVVLAAQLPFTLLAVTLGGVTMNQVLSVYVTLAAYMVFCANLGLFCSVCAWTSAWAAILTGAILVALLAAPPLIGLATTAGAAGGAISRLLVDSSTWLRLQNIMVPAFRGSPWHVQVASHLAAAGALFVLSCVFFEPLTREGDSRLRRWWMRLASRRNRAGERRSRRAAESAFAWKELQFGLGGWKGLVVRLGVYIVVALAVEELVARVGLTMRGPFGALVAQKGARLAMLSLLAGATELALQSARVFREEVRDGTLPILALLPRPMHEIAWGKVAGCLVVAVPAAVLLAAAAVIAPRGVAMIFEQFLLSRHGWLMGVQLVLTLYLTAYLSLVVRWGALPLALGLVYVMLPAIGYLLLMPIAASTGTFGSALVVWELVCIPLDVLAAAMMLLLNRAIGRRLLELVGR